MRLGITLGVSILYSKLGRMVMLKKCKNSRTLSYKMRNYSLFQDQLIYNRNVDMAQQLETYMATEKKYFVVVGAGHLIGDRSILTLLQAKRYQIDQLVVRERAN